MRPLIRSAFKGTASGYGSYDFLTLVTGCSRQRFQLLSPVQASLAMVLSQVCLKQIWPKSALTVKRC